MIRASGLQWTFLRDSFYADFFPRLVYPEDGTIRGPAGEGKLAWVARDDVARCAATVLSTPGHEGQTYDLTGPESLTLDQAARVLTRFSGRPITYQRQTWDEAIESRLGSAERWQVEAWVSTYTAIERGELDVAPGDVEQITGSPPISLERFLESDPEIYRSLIDR